MKTYQKTFELFPVLISRQNFGPANQSNSKLVVHWARRVAVWGTLAQEDERLAAPREVPGRLGGVDGA